jgi:hypothetical protein
VRTTLELIFARFEQIGTAHGLWVALCEEGIQIPVRSGRGGHLKWRWPNPAAVLRMLQNPVYAGAYVYGRRQVEEYLDEAQQPRKRTREQPAERWHTLISAARDGRHDRGRREPPPGQRARTSVVAPTARTRPLSAGHVANTMRLTLPIAWWHGNGSGAGSTP